VAAETASLISEAVAAENSDHNSAIAPVTKGAAMLVPRNVSGCRTALKLVTEAPVAHIPRLPIEPPRLDSSRGLPQRSQPTTGITPECRVMAVLPRVRWLPAAATTITSRLTALFSASCRGSSTCKEGRATARLRLMMRAPASMHWWIAVANSNGVALGSGLSKVVLSEKIGRIKRIQPGQIAGAIESRFADKIPATKVPCRHATLLDCVHAGLLPEMSRRFSRAKSGCRVSTGPSMRPIFTAGLPLLRCINPVSLISSRGAIRRVQASNIRAPNFRENYL
jgi:hypothetical protein